MPKVNGGIYNSGLSGKQKISWYFSRNCIGVDKILSVRFCVLCKHLKKNFEHSKIKCMVVRKRKSRGGSMQLAQQIMFVEEEDVKPVMNAE